MSIKKGKYLKLERRVAASLPFFDDPFDETEDAPEEEGPTAAEMVETASRRHMERDGSLLVLYSLGLVKERAGRTAFRWRAEAETSPVGVILDGRECGKYDWLVDFVNALPKAAGHEWAVGLLHGYDQIMDLADEKLDKLPRYRLGYECGAKLRSTYVVRKGVAA